MGHDSHRHLHLAPAATVDRRRLLKLVAASAALASAPGCSREHSDKILPYTRSPRHVTPGIPRYYATSLTLDGFATGVLVLSHEGRPTKVEGNPDHPASLGATSLFEQASILGLYSPDRPRGARSPAGPTHFDAIAARFSAPRADRGERLRFLLEPDGSPLLAALVDRVLARSPRARFTFHSAARPGFAARGGILSRGVAVQPQYDVGAAKVIVAIDDDLLASGPFSVRYARQFAAARRVSSPDDPMNRLYVIETMMTPTGSMADHRFAMRPSQISLAAAQLAAEVAIRRPTPPALSAALARFRPTTPQIAAIADDLAQNAGAALVTVGPGQAPIVHALGQLINALVAGPKVAWNIAPTLGSAGNADQDLPALAAELHAGAVDTLVILAPDPSRTAPADLDFSARLGKVEHVLYLAPTEDDTAARAGSVVPLAHPLESWGDASAYDGTLSLVQPLIEPLHGGRTAAEILAVFAGDAKPDARRLLEEHWSARRPGDFRDFWARAITQGVIAGTASPRLDAGLAEDSLARAILALDAGPRAVATLEVRFAPSPTLHDGRFADNAWLLEQPQPITKLTWDNAALLGPATASRLGLADEDVVELEAEGRLLRAPVLVVPGHADHTVTLHLAWGRGGVGFDAGRLRTSAAPTFAAGLILRRIPGARHDLALSQTHLGTEGRPVAPFATLAELRRDREVGAELRGPEPSLLAFPEHRGEQWAMTIDTTICTGCGACELACQAENNVPVVGKDDVRRGRLMHWLRIDTYLHGPREAPGVVHEPMLCQHCELAPCEYVCPVNATVHSDDGLNEMVYNRCVGTRFCSNNCPYKVRRFNWFDYYHDHRENQGLVQLQKNPDVTVRQRGVMEKCTYCVQRIREVEIHARIQGRGIRPGEVVTACQQACPTGAIQFGSLSHRDTNMVKWREEPRSFEVLHDLGTRPRTVYLARIDNPNPEMP